MMVDLAVAAATGRRRFDRGGAMAAAGTVDAGALAALMAHPYLQHSPPKSTGREEFGAPCLAPWLARARTARARRDLDGHADGVHGGVDRRRLPALPAAGGAAAS